MGAAMAHPNLSLLISGVQALGILAGLVIGYLGLSTWRRQRIEGRRIDIAEEALRGFARLKDILFEVASGVVWAHELEEIQTDFLQKFPEEDRKRIGGVAAPLHRLKRYHEEISAFFDQRYVCVAYFGADADKLFDRIRKVLVEVRVASEMLVTRESPSLGSEETHEFYEKLRHVIWMGSIDDHELHKETVSIADEATAFFGRELRRR